MPELEQEGLSYCGGMKNREEFQNLHLQAETGLKAIQDHPGYPNLDAKLLREMRRLQKTMPETQKKLWDTKFQLTETDESRLRLALEMKLLAVKATLSILDRDSEGKNTQ